MAQHLLPSRRSSSVPVPLRRTGSSGECTSSDLLGPLGRFFVERVLAPICGMASCSRSWFSTRGESVPKNYATRLAATPHPLFLQRTLVSRKRAKIGARAGPIWHYAALRGTTWHKAPPTCTRTCAFEGPLGSFLSVHGLVRNLFHVGRHLLRAEHHRELPEQEVAGSNPAWVTSNSKHLCDNSRGSTTFRSRFGCV